MLASSSAKVATLPKLPRHPPATLTRDFVADLKPEAKPYEVRDTELKGFLVRVERSGTMTYYVEVRRGKRLKIGRAANLKVHVARARADRVLGNVANNRDPWDGLRAEPDATVPSLGEFVAGSNPDEKDVRKWDGILAVS